MTKNYSLFVAAGFLLLAVSIFASAILISKTGIDQRNSAEKPAIASSNEAIMTMEELADYLSVSEETIEGIMQEDMMERTSGEVRDLEKHLPFVKLEDQTIFIKSEIDDWLKYKSGLFDVN